MKTTPNDSTVVRVRAAMDAHQVQELDGCDGVPSLRCDMQAARAVLRDLRDKADFEICTMITAMDHMEAKRPTAKRFDMIWQFQSAQHHDRVRLHAWLEDEEPGESGFNAPSVIDLWPGAAYCERECFDMFGIGFEGHEGLKRILMPEAYEHFPLRKEFPHGGIEPDKLYKAWDKARRLPAGDPS